MSSDDKRHNEESGKPLLSFSDAPAAASRTPASPTSAQTPPQSPPWTPPASKEEREDFSRTHDLSPERLTEEELAALQERLAAIETELDRKIVARERRRQELVEDQPSPQPLPEETQLTPETPVSTDRAAKSPDKDRADDNSWRPLIDPYAAIDVIKGSRKLLLVTTVLGGIAGVLIALSVPTMYVATTDVLVDPRNIKTVGTELTPGQLPTDASLAVAESQARIVGSSSVLLKVIDQTKLTQDPEFNGTLAPTGVAGFFAQIRDMLSAKKTSDGQALETRVLNNLYKAMKIDRDAKTFIYSISVKTRDPQKSASLANTISTVFQNELVSMQSDATRRTSEELSTRLASLRASVEQAETAAADFRAAHDLVDVDGKLISDSDLGRLNEQLSNQRAETMRLQARIAVMNSATSDNVVAGTLPEEFRSNTLTALRAQYAQARQAANGMSSQLGPRHPQLIQAQSQAGAILGDIDAELRRIRSSLQVEVQRSVQQEKELSARLAQLKAQQANNNGDLVKLRELEREAAARRSVYEAFLLRSRETGEQEGLNTVNIRVLSEARPPLDPSGTSRKLIVIAGLIAGLLAGLAITAVRNFGRLLRLSK
ncbi:uncharacterized protein involved in exopolysaccharide biosynthesis [Ochrobactrum sp. 19YEA23]|uniref:GumC family protein n=1 Tax=Ochrobactrum sp. 19YEA23 TaxID=3039854 RepID=UPI00247A2C1C|nr:uncharacterized protein involved in exopolysaccharide biosynthesis [Ochrobactrum sp. 19YEA23]